MSIDFDVSSEGHVAGRDEFQVLVDVLVLSALKERTFHDARVLLSGLID